VSSTVEHVCLRGSSHRLGTTSRGLLYPWHSVLKIIFRSSTNQKVRHDTLCVETQDQRYI